MALIIPPGFAHVVYEMSMTGDEEPMVTTWGHDLAAFGGGDRTAIANLLFERFAEFVLAPLNDAIWLERVTIYVGQDGGPPAIGDSSLSRVQAQGTGVSLPPNTAYLVRKRTDLAGRRGRGRSYLPGVGNQHVSETGVLTTTQRANMQGFLDAWLDENITPTSGAAAPPVILHRSEGIGPEPLPTPVITVTVEEKVATQRRRLRP